MSAWRVITKYGERYTRATSAAKARANVAYNLRSFGAYVPSGEASAWVAVIVNLGKPETERANY